MKIVHVGELVLRRKARLLSTPEIRSSEIRRLIEEMRETMHKAPGVGLAAPQVGASIQLAVIEDKAEYLKDVPTEILFERERRPVPFHVIINPVLTIEPRETRNFYEGCLSLPGFTAIVPRARTVQLDYLDQTGKAHTITASGWYARILQHEIDHLHGTVYVDRMRPRTFSTVENFKEFSKDRSTAEMIALLDNES